MTILKIEAKITPADQPLQDYQVMIQSPFNDWGSQCGVPEIKASCLLDALLTERELNIKSGKADDFEVLCRDGSFGIHLYCLFNSDFLYKQYKARENFEGEGKGFQLTIGSDQSFQSNVVQLDTTD